MTKLQLLMVFLLGPIIGALLILGFQTDNQKPKGDAVNVADTINYYPTHKIYVDSAGRCYILVGCPERGTK